jgi:hypothetical protein
MMDTKEFEKKKSLLVKNGLSIVKGLKETFEAFLKYDWYEDWEYPDEFRKINGTKLEPVEIKSLVSSLYLASAFPLLCKILFLR